jgi:hypothetical protein
MNEKRDKRLSTADFVFAGRERRGERGDERIERGEERKIQDRNRNVDREDVEYVGTESPGAGMAREEESAQLFSPEEAELMRDRWSDIQASFVDEPRRAVEQADSLVAECIRRLAESFADERDSLEQQWDRGSEVSTEDLRVALQRYRSFFTRLLSV